MKSKWTKSSMPNFFNWMTTEPKFDRKISGYVCSIKSFLKESSVYNRKHFQGWGQLESYRLFVAPTLEKLARLINFPLDFEDCTLSVSKTPGRRRRRSHQSSKTSRRCSWTDHFSPSEGTTVNASGALSKILCC